MRYRERVDGKTVYRSIAIGANPHIVREVRKLLAGLREDALSPREKKLRERLAANDRIARMLGYSGRARRRLRSQIRDTIDDPMAALKLVSSLGRNDHELRHGKPPGRPRKTHLW